MNHLDRGVTPVEGWWLHKDVHQEKLVGNKLIQLVKLQDKEAPYGVVSGTVLGTTIGLDDIVAFTTMKLAYQQYASLLRWMHREDMLKRRQVLDKVELLMDQGNTKAAGMMLLMSYDEAIKHTNYGKQS